MVVHAGPLTGEVPDGVWGKFYTSIHLPHSVLVPVVIKQKEPRIACQGTQVLFWALLPLSYGTLGKSFHFLCTWVPLCVK